MQIVHVFRFWFIFGLCRYGKKTVCLLIYFIRLWKSPFCLCKPS